MRSLLGILALNDDTLPPVALERLRQLGAHVTQDRNFALGVVAKAGYNPWQHGNLLIGFDGRLDGVGTCDRAVPESCIGSVYDKYGTEFPTHLLGEYATVVWEKRQRILVCARDTAGSRSLYYGSRSGLLAFASEPQLVLTLLGAPAKPDLTTVGLHLANKVFDSSRTLLEGVSMLPAAHVLIVERGSVTVRGYWDLHRTPPSSRMSDSDYSQAFLAVLRTAVADRVREGQSAIMLSGGLDSSAIACVTETHDPSRAYTLVSSEESFDESCFARAVATTCKLEQVEVSYEEEVLPHFPISQWRSTDILYSPMMRFCEALFRAAARNGDCVLMDGYGGDELLDSGDSHLKQLARAGRILRMYKQAASEAAVWGVSKWTLLWTSVFQQRGHRSSEDHTTGIIRHDFLKSTGTLDLIASKSVPDFASIGQKLTYAAMHFGWTLLFQQEQIELLARRCGVQLQHPFLDRRVVEFLFSLLDEQRSRAEGDRFVLRNAMRGIMPEPVRNRIGKSSLSAVIYKELRCSQVDDVRELFRDSRLAALGAVNGRCLQERYERFVRGSKLIHSSHFETLVGLELWLRNLEHA